jgi:hypothetical protein
MQSLKQLPFLTHTVDDNATFISLFVRLVLLTLTMSVYTSPGMAAAQVGGKA